MNRHAICSLLLLLINCPFAYGQDRAFSHVTTSIEVESQRVADELADTKNLAFDKWLELVGRDDWSLLHSSSSDYFYFAIFRDGHHLIMWMADRKGSLKQQQYGAYSNDFDDPERQDRIAKIGPSQFAALEREIVWPTGGLTVVDNATVFEIDHSLDGWIQVQIGGQDKAEKNRKLLHAEVPWQKHAQ